VREIEVDSIRAAPPRPALVVAVARRRPAWAAGTASLAAMVALAIGVWVLALGRGEPERPPRRDVGAAPPAQSVAVPALDPLPAPFPAPAPATASTRPAAPHARRPPEPATAEADPPRTVAPEPSAADLRRLVLAESERMEACYEEALRRDPTLGTVETIVTVGVGADGRPTEVGMSGSPPHVVRRCVESAIRPLAFPPIDEGLEVSVPLRFEMRAAP
jgi:hypothetical protein